MNDIKQKFEDYITVVITETFGFSPKVIIDEPRPGLISITLDGLPTERSQMMGREARNFQAIKHLARIYAIRYGYLVSLFIQPSDHAYESDTA